MNYDCIHSLININTIRVLNKLFSTTMAEKIRQQIEARRQQRIEKEKMNDFQQIKPVEDPVEKLIASDRDHLEQLSNIHLSDDEMNAQIICYERRIVANNIWFDKFKHLVGIDNFNLHRQAYIRLDKALDMYIQEINYARLRRGSINERTKLASRNLLQAKIAWDCEWKKLWKADFDQKMGTAWLEHKMAQCKDACYHLYDDGVEPRSEIQISDQSKNLITVKLRILHMPNRDIYAGTLLMDSNSIRISLDADTTYTETIDASKLDNTVMMRQWIKTMREAVGCLEKLIDCKLETDQTNGVSAPFSWSKPSEERVV